MPKVYKREYNDARKRNKSIGVLLSEEEKNEFKRACKLLGMNNTEFILYAVMEALKK